MEREGEGRLDELLGLRKVDAVISGGTELLGVAAGGHGSLQDRSTHQRGVQEHAQQWHINFNP